MYIEASNSIPGWEVENQQIKKILANSYEVKEENQGNILRLAKCLYDKTRIPAQPFIDGLFENGQQKYFSNLSGAAYSFDLEMNPKKGDEPGNFDELIDKYSSTIVNNMADLYDHNEQLKTNGLSEQREITGSQWPKLSCSDLELTLSADNFHNTLADAKEVGAYQTRWLIGLRTIEALFRNHLNVIEEKYPTTFSVNGKVISNNQRMNQQIDESINNSLIETIDNIDLALPGINKNEWLVRICAIQESLVHTLEMRGIERRVPKKGEEFNPKWQQAISGTGCDVVDKVNKAGYIDKSSGKIIQAAQVETV